MIAQSIVAHPNIRANAGRVAIQRGPLVYCLEQIDNSVPLASLSLSKISPLSFRYDPDLLGGAGVVEARGYSDEQASWREDVPYRPLDKRSEVYPVNLKFLPYYLWGNRIPGEMSVWVRLASFKERVSSHCKQ